jgi:hypothetical protein
MRLISRAEFAALMVAGMVAIGSSPARAQGYSSSGGYLPFGGGSFSGYVPFSGGPGGGLGVQPQIPRMPPPAATRTPLDGTSMSGGMRQDLGALRGTLSPLRPISPLDPGGLMGTGGSMIRRAPGGAGGMGGMARPPVGGYPFRRPPSIVTPNASSPAMSM